MKTSIHKLTILLAASLLLTACGAEISEKLDDSADRGTADFSTFVALGDSLTAGYADGALYQHGQVNSFPAILAQQLAKAGSGEFDQPLMPDTATGSLTHSMIDLGRADRLVLVPTGNPERPALPDTITPVDPTPIDTRKGAGGFNNMGVPGAKAIHLLVDGYGENALPAFVGGTANPYFARFSSNDTVDMVDDFLAQAPTFFTLWMGNNDVLLYAVEGGPGTADPPYGTASNEVSDPTLFDTVFNGALLTITTALPNAKGVLINVPDLRTIPYFNFVPYNVLELSATEALQAQQAYDAFYNPAIAGSALPPDEKARRTITFKEGANALVIEDLDTLTTLVGLPSYRQAEPEDLIILTASSKIGTPSDPMNPLTTIWGIGTPLLDTDVLIAREVEMIEKARGQYNDTIEAAAASNPNLVLFDAETKLTELNTTGIVYGSGGVSSTFAQGGFFSLDGIHPTARGYAVVANEIMKVIEIAFDAKLPPVDPNQYTTVFYQ